MDMAAQMTAQTKHFVITPEGRVREFTAEQAALVAAGASRVPEYADRRVHYIQVTLLNDPAEEDVRVQTAGACIGFDGDGRLKDAGPPQTDDEQISPFEHDACVQWALRELPAAQLTFH